MTMNKDYESIKQFCKEQRLSGKSIKEIVAELQSMGVDDWCYNRVKNATRVSRNPEMPLTAKPRKDGAVKEKEGATERKPKIEQTETGYIIRYGKNKQVKATCEQIEHAMQLFCLAGLTMNAVALQSGWSRSDFFAIKSAFEFTKDSIPLLPETIDGLSTDEIAEKIRIAKKKYAIQKIHDNKLRDIERDNKAFQNRNYLFGIAADRINAIDSSPFNVYRVKPEINAHLLAISDIHAGMTINNRFSKYNLDIMRQRFNDIAANVIELLQPCQLTILDSGDKVAGGIHASIAKTSVNPVDSVMAVTECYLKLFTTLMSKGFSIRFHSVNGNHDSTIAEKSARTNAESFSRLIDWTLRLKLANCEMIKFAETESGMTLIPFFDYNVLALHGIPRKLSRFARLFPNDKIIEVLSGHFHSYGAETDDNLPVYRLNALCSPDEYALGLGLSSEPGARLIEYCSKGRVCDRLIRFSE